ncbi:hypothetical protein NG42_03360 [Winslowiella iniecta]|uniref:Uncharacterized protein n=1 Tax=Winslowiella iniecta TaxID=1560201 RepID=A0A0L7T8X2_9GAMM|nr:hypothetical protein NG42_03360 [Winslowiella iniecta]KOC95059.1 hypothetical protein NG43_02365 [Winslowiella iniecta]
MLQTKPWKLPFIFFSNTHLRMLFNSLIAATLSLLLNIYKNCIWERRFTGEFICAMSAGFIVDWLFRLNIPLAVG